MAFRVFDLKKEKWLEKDVYLNMKGEMFLIKKSMFGFLKIPLALELDRYVYHKDTELYDKNGILIHEGDWLEATVAEDRTVKGIVIYAHELSAYIILCEETNEYFTLGKEVTELIKVIGNVFDGYKE